MHLARHDPNLCELNLCELNRPMQTRTEVIPASQDLVELVMPDTLTKTKLGSLAPDALRSDYCHYEKCPVH